MKKAFIICLILVVISCLFLISLPGPLSYRQPPIEGLVVDSETGEPVVGAIVVAKWIITGGVFETHSVGLMEAQRTVTDENGRFVLPGWERRWRRWYRGEFLDYRQPYIYILKFEYEPKLFRNSYPEDITRHEADGNANSVITLNRGGKPFKIEPLSGTLKERYLQFGGAGVTYWSVIPGPLFCGDFEVYKPALLEVDKWMYQAEKHGFSGYTTGSWLNLGEYVTPDKFDELCTAVIDWLKEQRKTRRQFYEDVKH